MSAKRLWITVSVMSATVMQVLDTTIINVALPNLAGELNASPDAISWVLTSYLMGSAVFMPLAGYFTDRLGRKRYLLGSIAGFVVSSTLCGLAASLPEMVLYRLFQGIFGAALVPLSQAIMVESYPPESRGKAMAIWGMGVMVAPILGPSLGGYLTEILSWRWTFFINIPVGIFSFLLAAGVMPDTPVKHRRMDWIGFGALAMAIASLQIVLDRGAEKDWFESSLIVSASVFAALTFAVFLWKSLTSKGSPVFDLTVLKNRNFTVACILMLSTGFGVFGGLLLLPLFLENLLGYPTMEAGLLLMPRGIATLVAMSLVGRLSNRLSSRTLLCGGILLSIIGSVQMTDLTLQTTGAVILVPLLMQGLGMGMIFIPLATLAFSTIPPPLAAEAAGLYSLMRTLGSSIGISLASTYLNHSSRVNWAELRGGVTVFNHQALHYLAPLGLKLEGAGLQVIAYVVQQQAMVRALVDTFWMMTVSFVVMLPLLLLIKAAKPASLGTANVAVTE